VSGQLISSRLKIHRAAEHLNSANRLFESFAKSDFYRWDNKADGKEHLIAEVTAVDQVPAEFSLLIGDAAHNIRSALDHIAFRFAKPQSSTEEGRVAFPINSRPEWFANSSKTRLPGVSANVLALFEKFQPYNSRKIAETELLLAVSCINNWDKHRAIPVALTSMEVFAVETSITGYAEITSSEVFNGRLEVGTILTRLKVENSRPGSKVNMKTDVTVYPIFEDDIVEAAGKPVFGTMFSAGQFIFDVIIPEFEKLL
jgi:hypothetical protein